jgi:tetratricopeptide (TPR) repeat protein
VITAAVTVKGNTLRVAPQLIDVDSGRLLWGQILYGELLIEGQPRALFAIQDSLTSKIVEALRPRLAPSVRQALLERGVPTKDLVAYSLYHQAKRIMNNLEMHTQKQAIDLLREAIERDSTYGEAWAALAEVLFNIGGTTGQRPDETRDAMQHALDKALEYDSLNGPALALRGTLRGYHDWDWDRAVTDLQRAVRLAPSSPNVASFNSAVLRMVSELDSAVIYARRAVELDPGDSWWWSGLSFNFLVAGNRDSADEAAGRAVALDSAQWTAYGSRMYVYLKANRRSEADSAVARYLRFGGDSMSEGLSWATDYYRRSGNTAASRELLKRLRDMQVHRFVPAVDFATALLANGDRAGALDFVERAARDHETLLPLYVTYMLYPLAGEPRFDAVRRKIFGKRGPPLNFMPEVRR